MKRRKGDAISPEAIAFLQDLKALCVKHGLNITEAEGCAYVIDWDGSEQYEQYIEVVAYDISRFGKAINEKP